ncbi:MAG: leucine-rich repeat protein [Ruminococcus callidus]
MLWYSGRSAGRCDGNRELCLYNCGNLQKIMLPASVTKIDWGAFWQCSGLETLTVQGNLAKIGESPFPTVRNCRQCTLSCRKTSGAMSRSNRGTNCWSRRQYTIIVSLKNRFLPTWTTAEAWILRTCFTFCWALHRMR